MSATKNVSLRESHPATSAYPKEYSWQAFLTKLVEPWLVVCRNRNTFNHCSERNDRSFKWTSKSSLTRCSPICHEVLNISQIAIAIHRTRPPYFIHSNNTADVPSFILRTALSAIPFVSDRWSVEVRWYHERSSQDLPNSNELSM